jgi:hypothetical protein
LQDRGKILYVFKNKKERNATYQHFLLEYPELEKYSKKLEAKKSMKLKQSFSFHSIFFLTDKMF